MGRSDANEGELLAFRGDGREAFRIVRAATTSEDDWRSHYELGHAPRRTEVGSALDHMSLSMFSALNQARAVNELFRGKLGQFVAVVKLRGDRGIWLAETGAEGHLAVWGRPPDLQRSVLAVEPV